MTRPIRIFLPAIFLPVSRNYHFSLPLAEGTPSRAHYEHKCGIPPFVVRS